MPIIPMGTMPLALVRVGPDQAANIVLRDRESGQEMVLTHFTEPLNMSDLSWSWDGKYVVFVSSHDFIHSRNNERNIFIMRPDGTELHMVTGDYVNPETAPGPYVVLRGRVENAIGRCLVCAQGAAGPVTTGADGSFELPGVPLSARWARAVCQEGDKIRQGDVDLISENDAILPVLIAVSASGQGWRQASLAREELPLAGTFYRWIQDEEGKRQYQFQGMLIPLGVQEAQPIGAPEGASLYGLTWSPQGDRLAGGLSGEGQTWLRLWDPLGRELATLVEFTNPASEVLSVAYPAWSPEGNHIAFEVRHWFWWEENKYKAEILAVRDDGSDLRTLVASEWGFDATHPSWNADGKEIIYQLSIGAPETDHQSKTNGYVWAVPTTGQEEAPKPYPVVEDGHSYLPAGRP